MKRSKLVTLVRNVLDAERAVGREPVTVDTLTICWATRTVTFRGRSVTTESDCITFPVLSTDHLVVSSEGHVL